MRKKAIIRIGILCGIAVCLQSAEYIWTGLGIELRTAAQGVKGICIWLLVPALILMQCYRILSDRTNLKAGKVVFVLLFSVVILIAGLFRGAVYVFSDEFVEEQVLEDGIIAGRYSEGLLEPTVTKYYEPVYGIFKRPFSGWSEDEITAQLKERYGAGIVPVSGPENLEDGGNGRYIYMEEPAWSDGAELYFAVENDYRLTNSYLYQRMRQDAAAFWQQKRRSAYFFDQTKNEGYEFYDERCDSQKYPDSTDMLTVRCESEEDILQCATDITDWMYYVSEDDRYYSNETQPEIGSIRIEFQDAAFLLWTLSDTDFRDISKWQENRQKIADAIKTSAGFAGGKTDVSAEKDSSEHVSEDADTAGGEEALSQRERNEYFMQWYAGGYEQEWEIEDGSIRYRMVVTDAAAGSRLYGLLKSVDAGATWSVVSLDPFAGQTGMGIAFTFLDEDFGFASLVHNGGTEAELYITEDGGYSYTPVTIQEITVSLDNGYRYVPYDYPQMPYQKDGSLFLMCGQGTDGDYEGGDAAGMALYESADGGHTFTYIGIETMGKES